MCGAGEMECPVEKRCITLLWQCDGVADCSDGADENNCESTKLLPQPIVYNFHCTFHEMIKMMSMSYIVTF